MTKLDDVLKTEEEVDLTPEQAAEADKIEDILITTGVLIPANDLVHYMTRNSSYMRLINSDAFKESGISLEEILDDAFIKEQYKNNGETAKIMRFVTEQVVDKMQAIDKPKVEQAPTSEE